MFPKKSEYKFNLVGGFCLHFIAVVAGLWIVGSKEDRMKSKNMFLFIIKSVQINYSNIL